MLGVYATHQEDTNTTREYSTTFILLIINQLKNKTMFKQEKQLRVLSKWLKKSEDIYMGHDGIMEQQIKSAVKECMFKIGDYLEEILDMDDEQLSKE
jgi:hypothetical protein|tara:strand:- start:290 stop:580 length:291 start_codon:yes stop_codon:yes gene_type:complete